MELALRVVEAAGAGPAIGAAEHRARPVPVIDAAQLAGEQVERLVPGDRHELVAAAAFVGARAALEPAAADHRPGDARPVRHRGRDVAEKNRGGGIARMRHDLDARCSFTSTEKAPQCELCGKPLLGFMGRISHAGSAIATVGARHAPL